MGETLARRLHGHRSAFAFSFVPAFYAGGRKPIKPSPRFNSSVASPPSPAQCAGSMSLAAASAEAAKRLIDCGLVSDVSNPHGASYLVSITDTARNVRAVRYAALRHQMPGVLTTGIVETHALDNKTDAMFYFTGLAHVSALDRNRFLPGAVADHITSAVSKLFGHSQMRNLV